MVKQLIFLSLTEVVISNIEDACDAAVAARLLAILDVVMPVLSENERQPCTRVDVGQNEDFFRRISLVE